MKFQTVANLLLLPAATASVRGASSSLNAERKLAPSSKFAAAWSDDPEVAGECLNVDEEDMLTFWSTEDRDTNSLLNFEWCDGIADITESELVLSQFANVGSIKIPQGKEILINLSAQIDILTVNTASSVQKGNGRELAKPVDDDKPLGNIGATSASAAVSVSLYANPQRSGGPPVECKPEGGVTMQSRHIELRNQIGGNVTYQDCYNNTSGDLLEELVCPIKVANTTLSSTIGLAMDTASAHSFQWLCIDMDSDVYDIVAQFTLSAETENLCEAGTLGDCADNVDLAAARVVLNKRIMTIQQVRATNNAFAEID